MPLARLARLLWLGLALWMLGAVAWGALRVRPGLALGLALLPWAGHALVLALEMALACWAAKAQAVKMASAPFAAPLPAAPTKATRAPCARPVGFVRSTPAHAAATAAPLAAGLGRRVGGSAARVRVAAAVAAPF